MKTRKGFLTLAAAMGLSVMTISAQEARVREKVMLEDLGNEFGPFETNKPGSNWTLGLDAGAVGIFGGSNNKGDFGKRIGATFGLNMQKWLTPKVGLRGGGTFTMVNGFALPGSNHNTSVGPNSNGMFETDYNMIALRADVLYNITNAWWGYRADRVYNCIPYVGMAVAHTFGDNSHATSPGLYAGIINRFRLSDAWEMNLEVSSGFYNAGIDRSVSGSKNFTNYTGLTLGVAYRFKTRDFKRAQKVDVAPLMEAIAVMETDLAACTAEAANMLQALEAERAKNNEVIEVECPMTPQVVFFDINSDKLARKERMNLKLVADMIKGSDAAFTVTGYADLQTGPVAFNEKLSLERAQAVADLLVKEYGVNASQLMVKAGDLNTPPFTDRLYNRSVVIMEQE